jgi:hypothetical protein
MLRSFALEFLSNHTQRRMRNRFSKPWQAQFAEIIGFLSAQCEGVMRAGFNDAWT